MQTALKTFIALFAISLAVFGIYFGAVAPSPITIETYRASSAILYGNGLYKDNSLFFGAGFIAQDFIILGLVAPLLIASIFLTKRGRFSGHLIGYAVLAFLLYAYASLAFSAAYNVAFFGYVTLLGATLFAVYFAHNSVYVGLSGQRFENAYPKLPKKSLIVFLVLAGSLTILVWAEPLITALLNDQYPTRLDHYTTKFTEAVDIAIIAPLCFVAAFSVWKQKSIGYVLSVPLLGSIIILLPAICAATTVQIIAGVEFSTPEIVGPIGGFLVLGLFGLWLMIQLIIQFERARPH